MDSRKHTAKRVGGHYEYRGATIRNVGGTIASFKGWATILPGNDTADDIVATLRDAKAAVDHFVDHPEEYGSRSINGIYFKGDAAEATGKTVDAHGGHFHEYRMVEGHRKGETIQSQREPRTIELNNQPTGDGR